MDEERRNGSNCDDKTIPLEEEQTVPLRENRVFLNQVRKPKLKHAWSSNERSSYNQSQGNRPPYGQSQDSQSWGDPHSQNPYQQGGQNPFSGNNNPYQQGNQNPYGRQPYPPVGQNPYSQQNNQNPYNHQPYPQGNFNAYGSQSYPQGNSNVYGQQSNLQGEPISYNQPSYIQTPVKVRSKMPFIIAGALIVILFLGGLAIGLISSNKSGTQANKNSQNAEQGDSSKILVQNGDFDTVVTVKSKDIDIELHTAGQYKRTLTLLGENTEEGREKFREELNETHQLFKDFVKRMRPSLDIEQVATGEHWYGQQAVEKGLVDEINTSDEVILSLMEGREVVNVRYMQRKRLIDRFTGSAAESADRLLLRWWQRGQKPLM